MGLKKEDMSGVRGGMVTLDNIFVNKTGKEDGRIKSKTRTEK